MKSLHLRKHCIPKIHQKKQQTTMIVSCYSSNVILNQNFIAKIYINRSAFALQSVTAFLVERNNLEFLVTVIPETPYHGIQVCINVDTCAYACKPMSYTSPNLLGYFPGVCPSASNFVDASVWADSNEPAIPEYVLIQSTNERVPCGYGGLLYNRDVWYCPPRPPATTTTTTAAATTTTTTTTTAAAASTPTLTCANHNIYYNKRKGNGLSGDCCKDQRDCVNQCIRGKCNGPSQTNTSCTNPRIYFGKGRGNAYHGDCCKDQSDCIDDCIKGKCNGPRRGGISTSKPAPTCLTGYKGKKKGNGPKNACCLTQADCKEDCVRGKCN
ncbi:uncharacterized protein BX663DRAFT_244782 [Cokeromyces recurvatus]|uniref:uncharacterized protein n=1 Tax=Cokeromyces recurvatus TaxID=90255 RepID=UPI0022212071|nr:uncharacterized protein BX663DRAFT_244782 [Cokeromyces recurvatus]KAI7905897.1 hypothetical protein BX663DRAFT_244782 [Cokeromyces recurvatus]